MRFSVTGDLVGLFQVFLTTVFVFFKKSTKGAATPLISHLNEYTDFSPKSLQHRKALLTKYGNPEPDVDGVYKNGALYREKLAVKMDDYETGSWEQRKCNLFFCFCFFSRI
jgi:hypothetical protein